MNIVLFTSGRISGTYGGGQIYVQNLLQGFEDNYFPVTVLALLGGGK